MRKLLLMASVLTLAFAGCEKDKTKPGGGCENGKIRYNNTSNNPYTIFLDGVSKGTMGGNTFKDFEVPKGTHTLRALQNSGFLLTPTDQTVTVNLAGCDEENFIFP